MRITIKFVVLTLLFLATGFSFIGGAMAQQPTAGVGLRQLTDSYAKFVGAPGEQCLSKECLEDVEDAGGSNIPVEGLDMGDMGGTQDPQGNLAIQGGAQDSQRQKPREAEKMQQLNGQHYHAKYENLGLDNDYGPTGQDWKGFPEVEHQMKYDSSLAAGTGGLAMQKLHDYINASAERPNGFSTTLTAAEISTQMAKAESDMAGAPMNKFNEGQQEMHGACQGASEAVADAFDPTWLAMLELQMSNLLNVANEASGTPSSAMAVTKTHSQAIWFVQRMYSEVYIPMALLLLLPGAVLTQMKGVVSFGILGSSNDEDAVSPFVGILRGMIAIFLIPACQLIVSYSIDVGNSLTYEVRRHVNPLNIIRWADEQVFRAPIENAKNAILHPSNFPVLGKLTEGPEAQSGLESQSTATIMLQTLANSMAESAAFGLVMLCAFQITMICYLMLMGPIAAAFYAWPAGLGNLFNRVFTTWVDAVINLSLWRFWWTVVLLCIDTRLGWLGAGYNFYSEWELLMFIAFLTILTYVPFNPFDFQAGEMVSQLMQKAEGAVSEASKKK